MTGTTLAASGYRPSTSSRTNRAQSARLRPPVTATWRQPASGSKARSRLAVPLRTYTHTGEGAKGPRLYGWAYLPYRGAPPGRATGLLVRRELDEPDEPTFHLTLAPEG